MKRRSPVTSASTLAAGPAVASSARHERLDALRGLAMVWMMAFHLCFDLNHFGLLAPKQNFYVDVFWTAQRTCIVSLFLFCAGMGQAMAMASGMGWPRFWRRWAQVAGCALLVSVGSMIEFPRSWISFGVLHGMAVMLVLARLLWPLRWGNLAVALLALCLPLWWQDAAFDNRWGNWTGLVTHKPITEDYVPVLPWLGVMLIGMQAGRVLHARSPAWFTAPVKGPMRGLALLGRWPLTVYMLHQPLFFGLLLGWRQLAA